MFIGVSVVLWVFLDFFWSILIFVISNSLGYDVHSANYATISVQSNFFNPAQFYLLVADFLNRQTSVSRVVATSRSALKLTVLRHSR